MCKCKYSIYGSVEVNDCTVSSFQFGMTEKMYQVTVLICGCKISDQFFSYMLVAPQNRAD